MRKIVIIGAGSAMFTQGLVVDLLEAPDLGPWELALVDTDPAALATAEGLSRRMVAAAGASLTISAATDRRQLLRGADVVVCTIGVGGRRAWEADVLIPRRYGIYQPVGDTAMPGGISRALRMIPALIAIARDVQALCPDALFFNYSNPMTASCWAVREATGAPIVGLCHGTYHVQRELAELIGAPPEEVTALAAGVNHLTWFTDLRWKGRDAWPLIRQAMAAERERKVDRGAIGKTFPHTHQFANNPFAWSLFATYGAYPSANDRHVVEFFPERFPGGRYAHGLTLGVDAFSFEQIIAWGDRLYADMGAQAAGEQPLDRALLRRAAGEHEQLLAILRSVWRDQRQIFFANLPNGSAVPNLPPDAIVEVPVAATAVGLLPLQLPALPGPLAAITIRKLAAIRLTVDAALAGSRALFVEALLADGAVSDPDTAARLADELLEAQRPYLPTFFPG